jgi:hypothetical protein
MFKKTRGYIITTIVAILMCFALPSFAGSDSVSPDWDMKILYGDFNPMETFSIVGEATDNLYSDPTDVVRTTESPEAVNLVDSNIKQKVTIPDIARNHPINEGLTFEIGWHV